MPSRVTAWLDARAESRAHLEKMLADVERLAGERAGRDGTTVEVVAESVSAEVVFDRPWPGGSPPATRAGTGRCCRRWPATTRACCPPPGCPPRCCSSATPPASRTPDEHAETADCLRGVEALADTLERLAGPGDRELAAGARLAGRSRRRVAEGVLVEVEDGRFASVEEGGAAATRTGSPG